MPKLPQYPRVATPSRLWRILNHGASALIDKEPRQAHADFLAAQNLIEKTSTDFGKHSKTAVTFLTYSGLTNARLQLAVHPDINPKRKDELMKSREGNLSKARKWHGLARQTLMLGDSKPEENRVERMIVRVDLVGIRAKEWEVKMLDDKEIDEVAMSKLVVEAEVLKEELDGMLAEGCKVKELVDRIDEVIADLKALLGGF
ncbi:hypothetical protein GLAREA_05121 [Glarea lozoyensis ATCC 20868]|uniref:Uncharacterized protein n=1 Tax=Glarea lozoyensis (strain ATCC 20868 / MF5171) TaxID=1116229 RepID=S3EBX3_GLAL2|nr:uncharacterized protein GLAREA_05121 [Glarea lozoyensis ATCC 20868]EPE35783.1 hypothetical protein GLAREA_05121 [Glarea lozoyensis ATCC 20868]